MLNLKEIKNRHFYYNNLYYDYIFNFGRLKQRFFYNYNDNAEFRNRTADILAYYDSKTRKTVSGILKDSNIKYGCSGKTAKNIESLKDAGNFAIIGGQQPGLFGGPLFIIYKIITIINLSRFCTEELGIPSVPVFWNATDDSNFSYINSAGFPAPDGSMEKVEIPESQAGDISSGKRYSDLYIEKELIGSKIKEFSGLLLKTEFTEIIEKFLLESLGLLHGSLKLPDLFSVIISKLFGPYGLIILDPSLPEIKKMALEHAYFDIENHDEIVKAISCATGLLEKSGYHGQLNLDKNAMNFYIVRDGIRYRVYKKNKNTYFFGKSVLKEPELKQYLSQNPSSLSLNVVLRPLLQDSILPVLSTVCGPGEVSYFAQLKGVYEAAGKKTGIIWPRFSATVIEKKVERSLIKTETGFENINPDRKAMLDRAASLAAGVNIDIVIKDFEDTVLLKLNEIKKLFKENGLLLDSPFCRIENNIKREAEVLKKKITSEINNKKTEISAGIQKILENVFPGDNLQERIFSIFYYINKYGFNFTDEILKISGVKDFTHKFILFNENIKK